MRKFLVLSLLALCGAGYADNIQDNIWSFVKNSSPFSWTAEIAITNQGAPAGKVVRTGNFCPRYYYDLYDAKNVLRVRGITRAFSLGLLCSWGVEIDLYQGEAFVGRIQGEVFTSSRAKFAFYDARGDQTAIAYLNDESSDFLIVSATSKGILAELNGKPFGDASIWEIKPSKDFLEVDESALKIFAGFVADYQRSFVRPPKREIYYYQESRRN